MREVPISCGFFEDLRNRFTLAFGEPITIAATVAAGRGGHCPRAGRKSGRPGWAVMQEFWKGVAGLKRTGLERGRRRTRQDQISRLSLEAIGP